MGRGLWVICTSTILQSFQAMGFFFSERMYAPVEHDFLPDLLREFFLGSGGVHEFFGKSMFAGFFFQNQPTPPPLPPPPLYPSPTPAL